MTTITTCADVAPDVWPSIEATVHAVLDERRESADALDALAARTAMTEDEQVRYFDETFSDRAARERHWTETVRARLDKIASSRR